MKERTKGNLLLLLTAILWGTGFISQKIGVSYMAPMTFNAIRQIMAFVILAPLAMMTLRKTRYLSRDSNLISVLNHRRKRLLIAGLLCGSFLFLGSLAQQIGLVTVSAGKSGFITAVYIVIVPIFSLFLGRRARLKSIFCIILAMIGFAILSLRLEPGESLLGSATRGDWWTLLSAAGFAAQIVAVDAFIDKDNGILISTLQMLISGVIGITIAILVESPTLTQIWNGMPILIYHTLVPTAAAFTLQIEGQKHTDASTAVLIMSLEAVFAAIFGAIILQEMMTACELLGCAIIFAATIFGQLEPQYR